MPADESRTPIRFGTDGWRAVVGEDYTFDNVRACAAALAAHMHDAGLAKDGAVVGYDTRFISDRFAAAVAKVLSDAGIATHLFRTPRSHSGRKPCHHDAERGRRGDHHREP